MYTANVKYWVRSKDLVKKQIDTNCFSAVVRAYSPYSDFDIKKTKSIVYKCIPPTKESGFFLDKKIQDFYIKFVTKLFQIFKYNLQSRFIEDKKIIFRLALNQGLINNPPKILLILTLCRYIQEFPEILIDFYKNKKNNLSDNFIQFQESHNNTKGDKKYYDNRFGHSIIFGYGNPTHNSISLKDFSLKFKFKIIGVQECFKSGKDLTV